MACMISFSLLDSVADLEKLSHPSHKSWFKTLAILRDMGLDTLRNKNDYTLQIREYSYCCVDQEHPVQVMYLYPECSDEKFKSIEAMCSSETSKLRLVISPLLRTPLSAASISRYNDNLGPIHPGPFGGGPKCLEFMTFHNAERAMFLYPYLEGHRDLSPAKSSSIVRHFSSARLDSPDEDNILFYCIEWKSFADRAAVYADPSMRKEMKVANEEHRAPILQAMGKTEDELTWEEDLSVFFDATGVKKLERQFVTATLITDKYLGISKEGRRRCVVL